MPFRERNVVGTVVDAAGAPVSGGQVQFKTNRPIGYTSTHVVVDRAFEAVTDAGGNFIANLWTDQDSLVAIDYDVFFPIENDGPASTTHIAKISLAYETGSDKDIGTLIAEGLPESTPIPADTLAAFIDARIAAAGGVGGGGTPGGGDTQIQYNNAGAFAGDGTFYRGTNAQGIVFRQRTNAYDQSLTVIGHAGEGTGGSIGFASDDYAGGYGPIGASIGGSSGGNFVGQFRRADFYHYPDAAGMVWDLIDSSTSYPTLTVTTGPAKIAQIVKLAAGQSANAIEFRDSADAVLSAIDAKGAFKPVSQADSAAANGTLYYSSTVSKLAYKDASGVVNALY
jgi:hypothetical protein